MRMSYKKGKDVKKKSKLGMVSVNLGLDKNKDVTQADIKGKYIVRKKAMGGGMMVQGAVKKIKKLMDESKAKKQDKARVKKMGGGMMRRTFSKGGGADRPGLYANIKAKKDRIKAGSGEKMRKPGAKGAPTAKNFRDAAKTAKKA